MTSRQAAILAGRGVVDVSGQQARDLLQGLVTSDVDQLAPGEAASAALLMPQGKILHEFILHAQTGDSYLLDTFAPAVPDLAKRLMFYRLRAKVDIGPLDDRAVVAIWGGDPAAPMAGAVPDPRLAALGWRAIVPRQGLEAALAGCEIVDEAVYQAHRIRHGVAELGQDYGASEVFPHEAGLDQLSGVDFDKGCFIGQEVVSRMQHRGTARSRFVPVEIDGDAPVPGTRVQAGGKPAGTMGSAAGSRGIALLRLDRIGDAIAAGQPVTAENATLRPVRPAWARFDWPGVQPADGAATGS